MELGTYLLKGRFINPIRRKGVAISEAITVFRDGLAYGLSDSRFAPGAGRLEITKGFKMEKDKIISEMVRLVGKENVLSSDMHIKLYEYDASLIRSKPDCIASVSSTTFCGNISLTYKSGFPILTSNESKFLSNKYQKYQKTYIHVYY